MFNYYLYIFIYSISFEHVLGLFWTIRPLFGAGHLLFGGILVFRDPPLTPLTISIFFYHFKLTHSSRQTYFILGLSMSGVIWGVIYHVQKSESFWEGLYPAKRLPKKGIHVISKRLTFFIFLNSPKHLRMIGNDEIDM